MLVLKNGLMFDGVSEDLKRGHLVIDGAKIVDVIESTSESNFENCPVLDLEGKYVTPGFIESHMHFFTNEIPEPDKRCNEVTPGGEVKENTEYYRVLRGVYSARKVLEAGFTTVFDGGGINFMDAAFKEALSVGLVNGPDYFICGKQITAGQGHFPGLGYDACGVWEMKKAVRKMLWYGADHIKLKMSAPMRMPGRNTERSEFTVPEIEAACEEAHSAGLLVSAHARGAQPIKDFIMGGGDRIVHGTGIDDEGIEMMLNKGLYLYPTIMSPYYMVSDLVKSIKPLSAVKSYEKKGREHFDSVKRAYEAGVKIAFATDSGGMDHFPGDNAKEMLYMKEMGMSNLYILRSATSEAAKALGISDSVGLLKKGYRANIVVLDENPFEKIETALDVKMVIHAGKVVKSIIPTIQLNCNTL
ncbi:Xaa-Pro dipeptidase [Synergistales bacterium]|nr:Xaa-Pro dipeptidase [Synergistales bacterium]